MDFLEDGTISLEGTLKGLGITVATLLGDIGSGLMKLFKLWLDLTYSISNTKLHPVLSKINRGIAGALERASGDWEGYKQQKNTERRADWKYYKYFFGEDGNFRIPGLKDIVDEGSLGDLTKAVDNIGDKTKDLKADILDIREPKIRGRKVDKDTKASKGAKDITEDRENRIKNLKDLYKKGELAKLIEIGRDTSVKRLASLDLGRIKKDKDFVLDKKRRDEVIKADIDDSRIIKAIMSVVDAVKESGNESGMKSNRNVMKEFKDGIALSGRRSTLGVSPVGVR